MIRPILLLGNPALYEVARPAGRADAELIRTAIADLHDTLMDFRARHGAGRAIAAPQIGVPLRLIYMHVDAPLPLLNPRLEFPDEERMEVLDDCMSFPGLLVRVRRHRRCTLHYTDVNWQPHTRHLEGDLSELVQHEFDHLNGILATQRAVDDRAFVLQNPNL